MSWSSLGETVDKGFTLLVTLLVILVAAFVFIVSSTAEDAIWDGLGKTFNANGSRRPWFRVGHSRLRSGNYGRRRFLLWALSKVRESL